jgi:hypothetical protein
MNFWKPQKAAHCDHKKMTVESGTRRRSKRTRKTSSCEIPVVSAIDNLCDEGLYRFQTHEGKLFTVAKDAIDALDESQIKALVQHEGLNTMTKDGHYDLGPASVAHDSFFRHLNGDTLSYSNVDHILNDEIVRLFDYHGVDLPPAFEYHYLAHRKSQEMRKFRESLVAPIVQTFIKRIRKFDILELDCAWGPNYVVNFMKSVKVEDLEEAVDGLTYETCQAETFCDTLQCAISESLHVAPTDVTVDRIDEGEFEVKLTFRYVE